MKIIIDENMPYAETLFSQLGEVISKPGRTLKAQDLIGIDALMIRSVTTVNASLLEKANKLKFVGTATAGFDHVDQPLLREKGIHFTAAPGCNKVGVVEYVLSCVMTLAQQHGFSIFDKTFGIVGVGQVGSYLAECLDALGISYLLSDPVRKKEGSLVHSVDLDELLEKSDIISLHTSLTDSGSFPTHHLLDSSRIMRLSSEQILINAARGAVVDNQALKTRLLKRDGFKAVLDVFEFEPVVDHELLPLLSFATPHIAGYSLEGKARGTTMIFNAFCEFLGHLERADPQELLPIAPISNVTLNQEWSSSILHQLIQLVYDVRNDDAVFRREITMPDGFDIMRKKYWNRREYNSITILGKLEYNLRSLQQLGFKIKEIL